MKKLTKSALLVAALAAVAVPPADAAEQLVPTKRIKVVNPASGNRRVIYKVVSTTNTLVGDPTATGASMHVRLTPGGTQCFLLPAANWVGSGTIFKYIEHTPTLTVRAVLKQTAGGTFKLLFKAIGTGVTVVPGNPTATYDANFRIAAADNYCDSGPDSALASPNNAMAYVVSNDSPPGPCPLPICSPSGAFLEPSPGSLF